MEGVVTVKPERKLWQDLKKNTPTICWNRIENLAVPGLPDVLGYNKHQHFFTVELKVTRSNKIRFSPHQIAFHVQHPKNTFILVKSLATRDWKLYERQAASFKPRAASIKLQAASDKLPNNFSLVKFPVSRDERLH